MATIDKDSQDALRQIVALVEAGEGDTLVEFLTPEQRKQLAEDWREGQVG